MSIYAEKRNGKLTGRWRVELQRDGQRYRKRFDTMAEAKRAEAEWTIDPTLAEVAPKVRHDSRGKPKTLEQLMRKAWPSLWRGMGTREQSFNRLAGVIGALDNCNVDELTTSHLDDVVADWSETKAGATINRNLSALNTLLKWGADRGYVTKVPKMPWQCESEGRIRWITEDEEARLLSLLRGYGRDDVADLVYCAIRTGMRRGELMKLEPKDIEDRWVRLWKTKTKVPRSVPVAEDTAATLRRLQMPSRSALRYYWDKARADMGLADDPWFVFHTCRHTCATRLVQANVNLRVIQRFMGHKRIETTVRYAQVNDEMLQGAITALGYMTDAKDAGEQQVGQTVPQVAYS